MGWAGMLLGFACWKPTLFIGGLSSGGRKKPINIMFKTAFISFKCISAQKY